jgi:hypothetical protein
MYNLPHGLRKQRLALRHGGGHHERGRRRHRRAHSRRRHRGTAEARRFRVCRPLSHNLGVLSRFEAFGLNVHSRRAVSMS